MSDFVAGGVVGIVQILIGHPFDTLPYERLLHKDGCGEGLVLASFEHFW
jgi:hypothetical protein